jgi:hypothetical protein
MATATGARKGAPLKAKPLVPSQVREEGRGLLLGQEEDPRADDAGDRADDGDDVRVESPLARAAMSEVRPDEEARRDGDPCQAIVIGPSRGKSRP